MSEKNIIIRNVFSNWTGYAVNVIIALLLSPFILHNLGDIYYGIWTIIVTLTGYYGLLDLGIRGGVSQYITRYYAKNELNRVNHTINTALLLLSIFGIICIILTLLISKYFDNIFEIGEVTNDSLPIIRLCFIIMGLNIAFSLPFAVFSAILISIQRFDISNFIGIITRILSALFIIFVLKEGYGLIGLSIVTTAINILSWILTIIFSFRCVKSLKINFLLLNKISFYEVMDYSLFIFIYRLGEVVVSYSDILIIGYFLGPVAVTYYTIARTLVNYSRNLSQGMTIVLTPVAITIDAQNDLNRLRVLLTRATNFASFLAFPIFVIFIIWGKEFIGLWMGQKYISGISFTSSATILVFLSIANLVTMIQHATLQIAFGIRKHKFLALLSTFEAVSTTILSIALIKYLGILGVAIGISLPILITRTIVLPIYIVYFLEMSFLKYLINSLLKPIICLVLMVFAALILDNFFNEITWSILILKIIISLIIFYFAVLFIGLSRNESMSLLRICSNFLKIHRIKLLTKN